MLAIILLFLGVFSVINPIQEKLDSCKKIGTDLKLCKETADCKFYEITERRTWDLDHALQVAIKAPDGATYAWYSGNVTSIDGLYITVSRNGCNSSVDNEIPCTVRESRFSFRFRESTPFEFVGMRIEVYREYFGRWISTNLTAIKSSEGDKWDDLWAFGGEFGDIVGLTPNKTKQNGFNMVHAFQCRTSSGDVPSSVGDHSTPRNNHAHHDENRGCVDGD